MSDITKIMEAYLEMVSDRAIEEGVGDTAIAHQTPYGTVVATKRNTKGMKGKQDGYSLTLKTKSGKTVDLGSHPKPNKANVLSIVKNMMENLEEGREECPKCEGKGCDHCDDKGYHEVSEKKLDPVDDKANDKKFKDRKDKDIDNDGDVDSSDEYLHKRRAATDDAIDGGKKPAKEEVEKDEEESEEEPKKKKSPVPPKKDDGEEESEEPAPESDDEEEEEKPEPEGGDSKLKKNPKTADKKAEISKIETKEAFEAFWDALVEATQKSAKGETPEDSTTPDTKRAQDMHKGKSDKKVEDMEDDSHKTTFKAGKSTKKASEPK